MFQILFWFWSCAFKYSTKKWNCGLTSRNMLINFRYTKALLDANQNTVSKLVSQV